MYMKLLVSLALFLAFLICPAACAEGVRKGLSLAAADALPALFPFFVASALLVRSGLADRLAIIAARPLSVMYGLPPAAAPAVILGLTGGYPVGAATAAELANQGTLTPRDAARVNLFCNCASPGFCIGLVGLGVFGNARTGAVLYAIHISAALLTGLFIARSRQTLPALRTASQSSDMDFPSAFCGAVQQSAGTAITVTAFLTVFSILLELLRPLLDVLPFGYAFTGLLELTNGLSVLPSLTLPTGTKLTLTSFLMGFGGLAVHFQVRAITSPSGLPTGHFTTAKLLHGAIAATLTAMLFRMSPEALEAFAPISQNTPVLVHFGGMATVVIILLSSFAIWAGKRAGNRL